MRTYDPARSHLGIKWNPLALILLARSFGQTLLRTCSPYLGQEFVRASAPGRDVVLVQSPVELITDYAMFERGTSARA
ncbi:MAG: hypothetical protein RL385_526 [Pseudomonadota bacterium]|jgi:hypothetical protein